MEEQRIIDRARLRDLLAEHPDWTKRQLAEEVGRSISWVKKWRRGGLAGAPDLPLLAPLQAVDNANSTMTRKVCATGYAWRLISPSGYKSPRTLAVSNEWSYSYALVFSGSQSSGNLRTSIFRF